MSWGVREARDAAIRVAALDEVIKRYGAIIGGLGVAIEGVLEGLPMEARSTLEGALDDVDAQLASAQDALDRALAALPEGSG